MKINEKGKEIPDKSGQYLWMPPAGSWAKVTVVQSQAANKGLSVLMGSVELDVESVGGKWRSYE